MLHAEPPEQDLPDVAASPLSPGEPREFGGGRYVVRKRLGAGNFATVYLADDERLAVPVAVKLLSDRWSWEPEVRGRFVQEARLLRSINDAHVVQIRDIAETADGRPYLVMDYATEGTLEQRLIELAQRQIRPGADDLRTVARALAAALGVLHTRRIAHRDIKPSNLLITRAAGAGDERPAQRGVIRDGERLMLGDLGLAKDLAFDSGITVGVGTAGYMAPEQTLPGAKVDTRTDIYAASALMAQLASGEPPDPARRVSDGRIEAGRQLPASIPAPLAAALLRGHDADPDARPPTIDDWLVDVERGLDALPPSSHTPVGVGRPRPRRRLAAIGVSVVAAGGLGVGLLVRHDSSGTASATTTSTSIPAFTVKLDGPTELTRGVPAAWTVTAPGATGGTWALTGPVQPDPADWFPGNHFQGTWNVAGTFVLTLTAHDDAGNTTSDSLTFTVK